MYSFWSCAQAIDDDKIDIKKPLDLKAFSKSGLIGSKNYGVKLLGRGDLKTKIEVHVNGASKNVKELIENSGFREGPIIKLSDKDKKDWENFIKSNERS